MTDDTKLTPPAAPVRAFDQIVAARKAHVDAVAAYNARLELVRAERERGNWHIKMDREYAVMSEAQSAFIRTVQELADAALSASPSPVDSRDALIERLVTPHAYAQEYEFRGDTDYTPSDFERTMIEDAILGYLGEAASSAEIDRLRRELEEARRALEPFADAADYYSSGVHRPIAEDALPCGPALIVKHLRAARAALRAGESQHRNVERSPKIPGTALYDHRKTFVHKP